MSLKVCHWTQFNHSGMNNVARSLAQAEGEQGICSIVINSFDDKDWSEALDADVHVAHTWFPELYNGTSFRRQLKRPLRIVMVGHGVPEHVFAESVEADRNKDHMIGDGLMLYQYWLQRAHARVFSWQRHAELAKTMVDTGSIVDYVPMGVDTKWWGLGKSPSSIKILPGQPALFSAENPHAIKWPLELIEVWPMVYPHLDGASLHLGYMVTNRDRQFAPLINRTTAGYGMHWSGQKWDHPSLKAILQGIDYFIGLVRYGDHNMLSQQANAAGAKTISYPGNPYSDFWVHEGDTRMLARDLLAVLQGKVKPRQKESVPDVSETAKGMIAVYKRILAQTTGVGFDSTLPNGKSAPVQIPESARKKKPAKKKPSRRKRG